MIDFFEIVEKRSKCHATWMTPITLSSQCFLLCHPSAPTLGSRNFNCKQAH
ncbi:MULTISPECIES: hypothetical protein [Wolbachia]|uniref:hypothetical protein n=1 Tax=Wolbachia TaxID=953 RepID=UPI001649C5E5|nr:MULTISPECIES: hypothetical protein [Wolbachia]UJQ21282.1 hypothetical protein L2227_01540 [Wolbachia endosymbiont of Delia radicum]